jgi:hypothetical protein
MTNRARALLLIATVLGSLGLAGLSCRGAGGAANPIGLAVTNVAGHRAAGETIRVTNALTGFVAGSLPDIVWGGFETNGRSTKIWEFWELPAAWPNTPPVLRWNTNNLMWGRKGMTAISQVWENMIKFGMFSVTALTRRHGYLLGHAMGPAGLSPTRVGRRVWFCTQDNRVIERKVQLFLTRFHDEGHVYDDYSIILFDADLPPEIEPMRVTDESKVNRKYLRVSHHRPPEFTTRQGGFISAEIPGWTVPHRGGDSGAPIMLPLPDELIFVGGLTTSSPSPGMQADMDMLSRKAGLDPAKYQMQWLDLDAFPDP